MDVAEKIRVLVVDDSAVARLMLAELIARDPELQLVGAESRGRAALEKLDHLRPDVVVLDVEMPEMGGVETVAAMRARYPRLPVIMFSAHTEEGAAVTIEALSRGAADYVTKPTQTLHADEAFATVRAQLLPKIKVLGKMRRKPIPPAADDSPDSSATISAKPGPNIELVCIAASTGGPHALECVLTQLPGTLPVPIVIVQHMPPAFTRQLAQWLAARCAIRVSEAESGAALQPGLALIAPGDQHLLVSSRGSSGYVITNQDPPENSCRPSADVLFRSAAAAFGPRTLALVLTGMGQDGLKGCEAVRAAGGRVAVQNEATSVVWGMPGAVSRAGLAQAVLAVERLAPYVLRRVSRG